MGLENKIDVDVSTETATIEGKEKAEVTNDKQEKDDKDIGVSESTMGDIKSDVTDKKVKKADKAEESKETNEKYKIKVNGQEREVTREQLLIMAQKGEGADVKFKEAAEVREQMEQIFEALKNNPVDILAKIGVDVDKLAEARLLEKLKYEQMNDSEKKVFEAEKKLADIEAKRKEYEDFMANQKNTEEVKKYEQEYTTKIMSAIDKSTLPKTEQTVKRIANYLYDGAVNNVDITAEEAAKLVEEDIKTELREIYGKLEGDKLFQELGDDMIKKIRSHDVSKIKQPQGTSLKRESSEPKPKKQKYKSFQDFKQEIHQLIDEGKI